MQPFQQLPPHSIRASTRARHPSLRASVHEGLVVVVPVGFDPARVPALFARHRRWVERVMKRLEKQRPLVLPETVALRPTVIELRALGERWVVEDVPTAATSVTAREVVNLLGESVLRLTGRTSNQRAYRQALSRWLQRRATAELLPWLQRVSAELGLPYRRASVRGQATRWGSCSRAGDISLNRKLLLLPSHLVRYVLVHEQCHTVEANHGPRFWRLVERTEPIWKPIRAELRTAWRWVPAWAE